MTNSEIAQPDETLEEICWWQERLEGKTVETWINVYQIQGKVIKIFRSGGYCGKLAASIQTADGPRVVFNLNEILILDAYSES